MPTPHTLLSLAGIKPKLPSLDDSALVLIDYQNDYLTGPLALPDALAAVAAAERVLTAARATSTRIIHVLQQGSSGGSFDRAKWGGQPIAKLAPGPREIVIEKPRPSSFFKTDLAKRLGGGTGTSVIFMGFMTHMCVSTTVRDALHFGYLSSVVADACASRDLPGPGGTVMDARTMHNAALAALGDRFAGIFTAAEILGDKPAPKPAR